MKDSFLSGVTKFFKDIWNIDDDKFEPNEFVDYYVVGDKQYDRIYISRILDDEEADKRGKGTNSCRSIRYTLGKMDGVLEQVYICFDKNTDRLPGYFHSYTRIGEKIKINYMTPVSNMKDHFVFEIKNKSFIYHHFPIRRLYKRIRWDLTPKQTYNLFLIDENAQI